MSMGYGNYEELLATYAAWLKWLREKKESLEAQKAKLDAGKKKSEVAAPVAAFGGDSDFTRLAGMDAPPEAPVAPIAAELPAEAAQTVPEAPVAPVVAEPPAEAAETIPEAPVAPVVAEPPAEAAETIPEASVASAVVEPAKVTDFSIAPVAKPAPAQPAAPPSDEDELV